MRRSLRPHPDSRSRAITGIDVEAQAQAAGYLTLSYFVSGNIDEVRLPRITEPGRIDELWRHTCFEAFLGTSGSEYYEFNLAPSTQWAAYHFSSYRSGMRVATEIAALKIEAQATPECYVLRTVLDLKPLQGLPGDRRLRLGLSALIEDADNHKSFWALAHPPGAPDFHHSDCFALEIFPEAKR